MQGMSMTKNKTQFACTQCGSLSRKWVGQCPGCEAWDSMVESAAEPTSVAGRRSGYAGTHSVMMPLHEVAAQKCHFQPTPFSELNRVLGGGLVPGAVILMGGDPGVGKSTLVLQVVAHVAEQAPVLYVSGEESPQQISLRAKRLNVSGPQLQLLAETEVGAICEAARSLKASVVVVDSIQTAHWAPMSSAPGSVGQVRECAALLAQFAKTTHTTVILIGHVTKTGEVAGPRVLEHIVDTVIYMEGRDDGRYRVLRATKNRFGAINELAVFAMLGRGMQQVANPSALFLSRPGNDVPGSVVTAVWEGTRPLLVELQALVDESHMPNPKRLAVGVDPHRLTLLLAVLHKHVGMLTYQKDIFVNVVGGLKLSETSADVAVLAAVISSFKNTAVPKNTLFLGEVGLSGEIRPVAHGQERMKEAIKQGLTTLVVPEANMPQAKEAWAEKARLWPIKHVSELAQWVLECPEPEQAVASAK